MMKQSLIPAQVELRKRATPGKARILSGFFKTGPGQYGEGDVFIGVTVPDARRVCRACAPNISRADITHLLGSPVHEDRFLGLCFLTAGFECARSPNERADWVAFYLDHRGAVNNWDLVDTSAYKVPGVHWLETGDLRTMDKLAASARHWDRRIAMVSTFAFIRAGKPAIAFDMAARFLTDREDLMHKASGWMLREAGKRDPDALLAFIAGHGRDMPRTMLRYSIERLDAATRKRILAETRE